MERRLAQMAPTTAWASPQPNDAVAAAQQDSAPPAAGEESTEAARAAAARHQVWPRVALVLGWKGCIWCPVL